MRPLIHIDGLVKCYGDRTILDGIDLKLEPGSILGLIGPNGAGKTTLFRCLLGLTRPTSGTIAVFGAPVGPATFERTAYASEESAWFMSILGSSRVDDLHEFQRRSFGARYDAKRARELRETFGIADNRRLNHLSKGQRTALWLTLAFAIRPALYILDEPTSGLDPEHQRALLDLMIEAAGDSETSVLFSSHQITQVERAADRVAILRGGKVVIDAQIEDLKARERIVQAIFDVAAPPPNGLASDPRVRRIESGERMLRVFLSDGEEEILRKIGSLSPRAIDVVTPDLETIYLTTAAPEARGVDQP